MTHDHHCRQCGTVLDAECPCPEPDAPDFCEECLVITGDDSDLLWKIPLSCPRLTKCRRLQAHGDHKPAILVKFQDLWHSERMRCNSRRVLVFTLSVTLAACASGVFNARAQTAGGCYWQMPSRDMICDGSVVLPSGNSPRPAVTPPSVVRPERASLQGLQDFAANKEVTIKKMEEEIAKDQEYAAVPTIPQLAQGKVCKTALADSFENTKFVFDANKRTWKSTDGNWGSGSGCHDFNFAAVDNPINSKLGKSMRLINRMCEDNRACKSWAGKGRTHMGKTVYGNRVEIGPHGNGVSKVPYGQDWWTSMRVCVPADFPPIPESDSMVGRNLPREVSVAQVIASQVTAGKPGTDFKLELYEPRGGGQTRWSMEKIGDLGPLERGKCLHWTIQLKRSTGADGILRVWKDGKLAGEHKGRTTSDVAATFFGSFKFGLYGLGDDFGQTKCGTDFTLYFDDTTYMTCSP
jgi:hypothetical protein